MNGRDAIRVLIGYAFRPEMTGATIYLAVVLLLALVSFYTQRLRPDVTALLVMLSLLVPWQSTAEGRAAILTAGQAFHGFGSPALLMVASMFVLSAAMVRTGAAQLLGGRLLEAGAKSELSFQLTVLVLVTGFSAIVNDTTTVLIWMPPVMAICQKRGYAPSRILILLAFASLLGGKWTLIGTRSNVILSDYLLERTGEGLAFFAFAPVGAAVFGACLTWFLLIGRRFLPQASASPSLESRYEVAEFLTETMAEPDSDIVGRTLGELDLPGRDVTVLQVIRGNEFLPPNPWLKVQPNDVLVIQGRITAITDALHRGLSVKEELKVDDKTLRSADLRMVEAILPPDSELIGQSLRDLDFHHRYGVSPLAISRRGRSLRDRPLAVSLKGGDSLLLVGHEAELQRLRRNPNLLLLESQLLPTSGKRKAAVVLGVMAAMVMTSATGLLEPAVAIPFAAMLAVLTGCVGMRRAYETVDLQALVIVGAMIPFGEALQVTGTAQWVAESMAGWFEGMSPRALRGALLLRAVLMTQLIENAAVAVVLAPIAFALAQAANCNPAPFLLGVAICVSSAFMTPVAHESTILVMGPGRYRFRDYVILGGPFAALTWLVTTITLPWFVPLK
ncbi:MAG: SLC13 family permease [Planctomycetota bacterium]|nr:SLC13 family permease [Planctomycetota bacterium]